MKRLLIAAILLAAVLTACFGGAKYVRTVCENTDSLLSQAERAFAANDTAPARQKTADAAEYWKSHRLTLFIFMNRGAVDDITESLEILPDSVGSSDFHSRLRSIIFHIGRMTAEQGVCPEDFV